MSALRYSALGGERLTDRYRAFLFDLDGVLLLSGAAHEQAYREALAGVGADRFDYPRYAGMRTAEALRLALRDNGLDLTEDELRQLAARKTELAALRLERENPLAPECVTTLERLQRRTRLALVSSASRRNVRGFLDRNGVERLFQLVLDGEDVAAAKPSPEIYLRASAELGLSGSDCLVIEDSLAGVQAGRAAGADVCGVSSGLSEQALRQAGCRFVIGRLSELLA